MFTPTSLPACSLEDGSGPGQEFPCLWDAAASGNGEGHSFVLDSQDSAPHYVTEVLVDGAVLTSDALPTGEVAHTAPPQPTGELAHTGIDPLVALVAGLMVAVGVTLKAVTR